MSRKHLLLALIAAFGTAAAQPLPKDQSVIDGGDQAAGTATPSRDTAPQPYGTGTPPTNTGADASAARGPATPSAPDIDKPSDSTVEVKPNAAGVAPKPPPSDVNPPQEETPKRQWPREK
jgi:hypothetical protein